MANPEFMNRQSVDKIDMVYVANTINDYFKNHDQ